MCKQMKTKRINLHGRSYLMYQLPDNSSTKRKSEALAAWKRAEAITALEAIPEHIREKLRTATLHSIRESTSRAKHFESGVKTLRKGFLPNKGSPFPGYEEAWGWIQQKRVQGKGKFWAPLPGKGRRSILFPFVSEALDTVVRVPCRVDSPLVELGQACRQMATEFFQVDDPAGWAKITVWILLDHQPIIPSLSVSHTIRLKPQGGPMDVMVRPREWTQLELVEWATAQVTKESRHLTGRKRARPAPKRQRKK